MDSQDPKAEVQKLESQAQTAVDIFTMVRTSKSFGMIALGVASVIGDHTSLAKNDIANVLMIGASLVVLAYLGYRHFLRKTGTSTT